MTRPTFNERNQPNGDNRFGTRLLQIVRTVTCDSVSPVAIFARASKTANRIAARRLRVAVVFVATAFVYIFEKTNYKLDSKGSADKNNVFTGAFDTRVYAERSR